jgi:arylsulfatase A-like enzyme
MRSAERTSTRVLAWLRERAAADAGQPFFLWVHYWDVHEPNDPPEPFRSHFRADAAVERLIDERGVDPEVLQQKFTPAQIAHVFYPEENEVFLRGEVTEVPPIDRRSVLHLYDQYDGSIAFVDHHLGRVLRGLDELGLSDTTLIAVTADHGQSLGQHDWLEHGRILNEIVRVPLVMVVPRPGIQQPQRIERVVSTVDVMPTLVARLAHPAFASYMNQVSGEDVLRKGAGRDWAFSHRTTRPREWEPGGRVAIGSGHWRYYDSDETEDELYDLSSDAGERLNVIREHPAEAKAFERQVREILATKPDIAGRSRELSESERAELEAGLRETGYLGDDEEGGS